MFSVEYSLFQYIIDHRLHGAVSLPVLKCLFALPDHPSLLFHGEAVHCAQREGDALRDDDLVEVQLDGTAHIQSDTLQYFLRIFLELVVGTYLDGGHETGGEYLSPL